MAGGLGGLGGFDIGGLLGALGQSLLSSPSGNPFQNLPQTMQAAQQQREHMASLNAMSQVAKKLGIPEEIAANPVAMSLLIQQLNTQKQTDLTKQYLGQPSTLTPPGGDAAPSAAPAAPGSPAGGLGGLGGMTAAPPATGLLDAAKAAIKNNESAGSGGYSAIGPDVNGDRAYGAYQVMGANIPEWTKRHLGKEMSVREFVASPEAQDKVFEGEFGGYLKKYGNINDAAAMWFSGRPMAQAGNASDGYTTVPQYVAKVNRFLAQSGGGAPQGTDPAQPYQVAAAGKSIPVPINPPPLPAQGAAASGGNATKAWAQQNLDLSLKRIAVAEQAGLKGVVEAEKAKIPLYTKWLEPLEAQRRLEAAGIDPNSEIGRDVLTGGATLARTKEARETDQQQWQRAQTEAEMRQRERLATMTDAEKAGLAEGRSPGLVETGRRVQAEQAGAETSARDIAAAKARFQEMATGAAQASEAVIPALKQASLAYEAAVKGGGTGLLATMPTNRALASAVTDIPLLGRTPFAQSAHANEVARQKFDQAMSTVGAARAAAVNKAQGGGNMSGTEQVLARADLPSLRSADPEVARQAFKTLQDQLERALDLDKRMGLFGGSQSAMTPRPGTVETPFGTLREKR